MNALAASAPIATTCPYCGVGCGLAGVVTGDRTVQITPDRTHPANAGRICSKGAALGETVGLTGRLLRPTINGRDVKWKTAIDRVATGLQRTIEKHGPDAVAFYVSGQLLTEDYYAANKLMKGFIGSGNIDTNSRLCMASAVIAHTKAFGGDLVPGCYEDLDLADLVVFSGHNAAWTHPVLYRRMEAARARGQRHVVIDPRRTDTADGADLHLAIAPQSDVRLWNGLLAQLINVGAIDQDYIAAHTTGFDAIGRALADDDQSVGAVAADCGVAEDALRQFFTLFAATARTVTLFSMGTNQSAQGVAKGLAILNVHLATGRIGKPGACPFSITGQPNAMGGREVGGMATVLAAHMGFDDASCDRVSRFWSTTAVAQRPGLKAIDMFDAVHDGRIKAIWIMATNPAVSLPNSGRVREALAKCPLVIVSDCMEHTDTTAFAHIKLPALAWGEKDGTVTNSERCISRQRPLFPPPGKARADWRIVADVASRMGHGDAFSWRTAADVFREHVRLTAFENDGRLLNLRPLVGLSQRDYDALAPAQWPFDKDASQARLFTNGVFATADGRARLHALSPRGPASPTNKRYPLSLNTGRVRDQWHTMTRSALAPHLCQHTPEPYLEIHPLDAETFGIVDGKLTCVETAQGGAVAMARVSDRQRRGSLFMPMHWTDCYAPEGRANALVRGDVDPASGQPEFKHTPARAYGYRETWRGFLLARDVCRKPADAAIVWRHIPQAGAHLYEFAGRGDEAERALVHRTLTRDARGDCVRVEDARRASMREAYVHANMLDRVFFIGDTLPARDWLSAAFEEAPLSDQTRKWLLNGQSPGASADRGPIVCACASVGAVRISLAIQSGARTLDAVGAATGAGLTCGSCRPEIRRLLDAHPGAETTHAA